MNRRDLLLTGSAALLLGSVAHANPVSYEPGLVDQLLAEGHTVFVDFYTDWCPTCRSQMRTIEALRGENPAYDEGLRFVNVNWDQYSGSELARRLNIPRRSTLVLLRGEAELGRIVAGTSRRDIQALMDLGLSAA